MGKKIICYIQAFDCEHTIEAAMRSVRDQTYDDWLCFVLSNGNRNTVEAPNWSFDVIKNVAAGDPRFVVLNKAHNNIDMYIPMLYHLAQNFPDSFICSLDADDVYQKDFFTRAVALAERESLDIVACGTEIVRKKNAEATEEVLLSRRAVEEDLIIREEDFTRSFAVYKPFFNEMWGKLYRASLFGPKYDRKYAERHLFWRFLPDTLFTVDNLSRSSAIGILSGTSHKFYQYEQRNATNATLISNAYVANHWSIKKALNGEKFSVYTTYDTIMAFLCAHGEVDGTLYEYMQAVLIGWFGDYYTRTLLPTQEEKKFSKLASQLIFHPKFDEVMLYQDSGKYNNLRGYDKRVEFCRKLRNTALGQKAIRNRRKRRRTDLLCSAATAKKLDQIIQKLDRTMENLLAL